MARILVAEDTNYVQFIIQKALAPAGHDLTLVKDGIEARDILLKETLDLALLDLQLPGMKGDEVIRQVHREKPKLPFLVISGYIETETETMLRRLGAAAVMKKPVDLQHLLRAVDTAIQPTRRILLTGFDEELKTIPPIRSLQCWDYGIEAFAAEGIVIGQIVHRAFDAVLIWSKPANRRSAFRLCRKIRKTDEWLPIFLPLPLLPPTPEQLDFNPIPWPVDTEQELLRLLAGQIGLQKTWTNREAAYILLAGKIDREDVLEPALGSALSEKQCLVVDLMDVSYLGPYCRKSLETTLERSRKVFLDFSLVLQEGANPPFSAPERPEPEQRGRTRSRFRIFRDRNQALESAGFENRPELTGFLTHE